MTDDTRKQVDLAAARAAFERAASTHSQEFGRFFLAQLLGFEIGYSADACTVEFDVEQFMFNPQGTLHGGIICLAMDVSMGHLLAHLQGPGSTLELKTQFLGPVAAGRVKVVGRMLRQGRSICFLESRFFDAQGQLAAFATATWKLIKPSADR